MKKLLTGAFALLALVAASWQQALAQDMAASSLNGIWLNTTPRDDGGLAFLTIIHSSTGDLAIISTNYVNLLGLVEGYQSGASVGNADTRALGDNIGTAMSVPDVFYGADLSFSLHRPSQNELIIELTSCSTTNPTVSCELIYAEFPLNEGVLHTKVF